jgi:hypothetical protein
MKSPAIGRKKRPRNTALAGNSRRGGRFGAVMAAGIEKRSLLDEGASFETRSSSAPQDEDNIL